MSTLVVVDGHNVYNDAGRLLTQTFPSRAPEPVQRAYFREWFDIDRLINATLDDNVGLDPHRDLGGVVFHSKGAVGKDTYRLDDSGTTALWERTGSAANMSTLLVEVPGLPKGKDRSVDISIVVYLFETVDKWEAAVLFTQDGDFAPAVWSLRRRGKRFYCSLPSKSQGLPLVQACQSFIPWAPLFLRTDRALFECLSPDGVLDRFIQHPFFDGRSAPVRYAMHAAGLRIEPGFGGGGENVLNQLLRDAGITELRGKEGQMHLLLQPSNPDRPDGTGNGSGRFVFEGLFRHAESFERARWFERFDRTTLTSPL
jgi:hypothetical protein